MQACAGCETLIDVSEQEPLARIHCPLCGAVMDVRRQFGPFLITALLGKGGMSAVYRATDVTLNRPVALKLLPRETSADPAAIARLEEEARITASVHHPHVVRVFSFGQDRGQYYLAMELVEKGSLDDLMQLQGRVAESQALEVGRQIAEGLKAAHQAGLIHRDVKPGNILFADARNAKITDFGLALLTAHEAGARGEIWGTPYYIAPEKLHGEPEDHRSDMYSLGGTLFHAIAGRPTFEAPDASLVTLKHLKSQAVSLQAFAPDVSVETAYVIDRMLQKDPAARYETYEQLIEHLQYAADKVAERTARPPAAQQQRRRRRRVVVDEEKTRSLTGFFTLVLLLFLLGGAGLAFLYRDRFFPPSKDQLGRRATAAVQERRAAEARRAATLGVEEAFQEARRELIAGNFTTALDRFAAILRRQGVTRPRADWLRLHLALTALFDRQVDTANGYIRDQLAAGFLSNKPSELRLANFFEQTAKFLADPGKPVPSSATRAFDNNSVEAFSLLLFGLRDWEVGALDDGARLLEDYLRGTPPPEYRWIEDYEPLVSRRLHDYHLYAPLVERLKSATTAAAQEQLITDINKTRDVLQSGGKIAEMLDVIQADARSRLEGSRKNESDNAATRATAEQDEDKSRWTTAREVAQQSFRMYRFQAALATFNRIGLRSPDYVAALTLARERAKLLVEFKRTLLEDLNTPGGGYPQQIVSRTNVRLPKGIKSADEDELRGETSYGEAVLKWPDLSPHTLLDMAVYFADRVPDPKAAANRRWLAANFALDFALIPDARALAERAVKDLPELRADLPQFYGVTGPPKKR